jgi:hypothetical protein
MQQLAVLCYLRRRRRRTTTCGKPRDGGRSPKTKKGKSRLSPYPSQDVPSILPMTPAACLMFTHEGRRDHRHAKTPRPAKSGRDDSLWRLAAKKLRNAGLFRTPWQPWEGGSFPTSLRFRLARMCVCSERKEKKRRKEKKKKMKKRKKKGQLFACRKQSLNSTRCC